VEVRMKMTDEEAIVKWVALVNKMAREMDEKAASVHPSAWPEMMKAENEKYRKLAAQVPEVKG
jgi:hypothetical protein